MSTVRAVSKTCRVCGTESEQSDITSTNQFGSPDLDFRPPEMARSTMQYWVQECPECGYVAGDIESDETTVDRDWLSSDEYTGHDDIPYDDHLTEEFHRRAKVARHDGNTEDAAYALLDAAWQCDDNGDAESAWQFHRESLSLFDELLQANPDDVNLRLQILDIKRRARLFDEVAEEYHEGMFDGDDENQIVAFQLEKAKAGDDGCYTIQDAMGATSEDEEEEGTGDADGTDGKVDDVNDESSSQEGATNDAEGQSEDDVVETTELSATQEPETPLQETLGTQMMPYVGVGLALLIALILFVAFRRKRRQADDASDGYAPGKQNEDPSGETDSQ